MSDVGAIAVTGLGGFIGRSIVDRLVADSPGLRIVGIDHRRPFRLDERVRFHAVDLTDPTADVRLAEVLHKERVDVLLHAAFRSAPRANLDLDHELETIGSIHVMNACAAAKIHRLVVASTTMAYGPWPDNPNFLSESHPLRAHPDAHNVCNRAQMEALLGDWKVRHPDTEVTVLRTCWIAGPVHQDAVSRYFARPVVPTLMGYDPLMQFVHEEDCLAAFERAVLESHPGIFNVVGSGVLPLSTLLRQAGKRILALPSPILYRMAYYPSQGQTGDSPAGFYDYLRYLWVADGRRGFDVFGEPLYTTREAWMSFISERRMRRYR
ncbi:MAG: NAD-dependent epimerase/dehydratase family protein [Myxococcales bacterium]|nr:NAD-dependent epimerase/dehydratase family protein [Myxococcales bacterium]